VRAEAGPIWSRQNRSDAPIFGRKTPHDKGLALCRQKRDPPSGRRDNSQQRASPAGAEIGATGPSSRTPPPSRSNRPAAIADSTRPASACGSSRRSSMARRGRRCKASACGSNRRSSSPRRSARCRASASGNSRRTANRPAGNRAPADRSRTCRSCPLRRTSARARPRGAPQ
jgi:hypothetical protein